MLRGVRGGAEEAVEGDVDVHEADVAGCGEGVDVDGGDDLGDGGGVFRGEVAGGVGEVGEEGVDGCLVLWGVSFGAGFREALVVEWDVEEMGVSFSIARYSCKGVEGGKREGGGRGGELRTPRIIGSVEPLWR